MIDPTDRAVIEAVAKTFNVSNDVALQWMIEVVERYTGRIILSAIEGIGDE